MNYLGAQICADLLIVKLKLASAAKLFKIENVIPKELKAHRYTELDSLRGLAAGTVVIHHFALIWMTTRWFAIADQSPLHILIAGREAVVLFFVLSGFVLSVPYRSARPPSYSAFLLKRLCRIYLPYAAAVVIAAICCHYLYDATPTGNAWVDKTWNHPLSAKELLLALLTKPSAVRSLNVALWTLVLEIRVSIIFPFLFWLASRVRSGFTLTACALLCLLWPVLFPHYESVLGLTYVSGLFLAGIALYKNLDSLSAIFNRLSATRRFMFLCGSILLFEVPNILVRNFDNRYPENIEDLRDYVIGVGAIGILVFVLNSKMARLILNHSILVRLGGLSYSTYLMHGTILFVLIRLYFGRFPFYYLFPAYLLFVYLVSELFHALIDQPAVMLGRRVGKKKVISRDLECV